MDCEQFSPNFDFGYSAIPADRHDTHTHTHTSKGVHGSGGVSTSSSHRTHTSKGVHQSWGVSTSLLTIKVRTRRSFIQNHRRILQTTKYNN